MLAGPHQFRVIGRQAGFAYLGEANDEHDGVPIRLHSWEKEHRPGR